MNVVSVIKSNISFFIFFYPPLNPVPKVKANARKRAKPISHTIVPTKARPLYHLLEESLPSLYNKLSKYSNPKGQRKISINPEKNLMNFALYQGSLNDL